MVEDLRSLTQEHHAFYEVLPYYVVVDRCPWASRPRLEGFMLASMLTSTA